MEESQESPSVKIEEGAVHVEIGEPIKGLSNPSKEDDYIDLN